MSTFQVIQDRIAQEYLNRATFTEEIKTAIKAAVRFYENRRTSFNETATAVATVATQAYIPVPTNMLIPDELRLTISGVSLSLLRRTPNELREMNSSPTPGQPTHYAIYQNRFNLFATPDAIYPGNLYYLKQLPALSAAADTNGWLQGTWEDVITYHAAKLTWANALRNDQQAAKFASLERLALMSCLSLQEQRGTGQIVATPGF